LDERAGGVDRGEPEVLKEESRPRTLEGATTRTLKYEEK